MYFEDTKSEGRGIEQCSFIKLLVVEKCKLLKCTEDCVLNTGKHGLVKKENIVLPLQAIFVMRIYGVETKQLLGKENYLGAVISKEFPVDCLLV